MRRALPAVAAAAALLCTACMPVPFDLALSQAAGTAARMSRDVSLSYDHGYDQSAHDFAFFPQVLAGGPDYSAGFVVYQRDLQLQIEAVRQGSPGHLDYYGGQQSTSSNPDPHAPPFGVWSLPTGTSHLLTFQFDSLDPFNRSGYTLWHGDGSTSFNADAVYNGLMWNRISADLGVNNAAIIGASVSAGDVPGTFERAHWIGANTGVPGQYLEFSGQASGTGLVMSSTPRGLIWADLSAFIPSGLTRCTYFYDEDATRLPNRSFASWWDSGSGGWVSYAWWETPATGSGLYTHVRLPVDHRIDALLSTGQLFSTEDGTGRVYDRDGATLATFTLGNLVFLGEVYVGGSARCYFSQSLVYSHTLHFNVYWIASSQLATLGN